MVEQTIQVIRDTEAEADLIIRAAQENSIQIIENAMKTATEIKDGELQKAKRQAAVNMQMAEDYGKKIIDEQTSRIEKEVQVLKAFALKKEEEAINLVISQLVG